MLPQRFQDAVRLILDRCLVPSIGDVRLVPAGSPVRAGWLKWEDLDVSRETYAELFRAIGVRHGSGDGVTTFRLGPPDLEFWIPDGLEWQIRVK